MVKFARENKSTGDDKSFDTGIRDGACFDQGPSGPSFDIFDRAASSLGRRIYGLGRRTERNERGRKNK